MIQLKSIEHDRIRMSLRKQSNQFQFMHQIHQLDGFGRSFDTIPIPTNF